VDEKTDTKKEYKEFSTYSSTTYIIREINLIDVTDIINKTEVLSDYVFRYNKDSPDEIPLFWKFKLIFLER
jgi:hypothetical protein